MRHHDGQLGGPRWDPVTRVGYGLGWSKGQNDAWDWVADMLD